MKVFLAIMDGLNFSVFKQAFDEIVFEEKNDPIIQEMAEKGILAKAVTTFPTVTHTEHASIMTGRYPDKHLIAGIKWYHRENDEYISYNPHFNSFAEDLSDIAFGLNLSHLNCNYTELKTIFETLGEEKKYFTVSLKELIMRGPTSYFENPVTVTVPKKQTQNKSIFDYYYRYQWNYRVPDFLVYWKIDTDNLSHIFGPFEKKEYQKGVFAGNRKVINEVKKTLFNRIREAIKFYKWEQKEEVTIFITADHSQSMISPQKTIEYAKLLKKHGFKAEDNQDFKYYREKYNLEIDLLVVNNGRSAYIFFHPNLNKTKQGEIIKLLTTAPELSEATDLIIIKETKEIIGPDKKRMSLANFPFSKDYPLAQERLEHILNSPHCGDLIISLCPEWSTVNVKPNWKTPLINFFYHRINKKRSTFWSWVSKALGAQLPHYGDHGSLLSDDSIVPLFVFQTGDRIPGLREKLLAQSTWRTVDLAPTIAKILKQTHIPTDGKVMF